MFFSINDEKYLARKGVQNWVEKFSQGRSKASDDAREDCPAENATEINVQRREESR
jgi:hypothetical protein